MHTQGLDKREKLYVSVYSKPRLAAALGYLSTFFVCTAVVAYLLLVILVSVSDFYKGISFILESFLPFLTVSVFRKLYSAKRPYEVYDFSSLGIESPKEKKGSSFPSRHVFSIFLIGTLAFPYALPLAVCLLVFGVMLGACRVLLGIHFVRDVVAGALIGVASGVIGLLI